MLLLLLLKKKKGIRLFGLTAIYKAWCEAHPVDGRGLQVFSVALRLRDKPASNSLKVQSIYEIELRAPTIIACHVVPYYALWNC